MRPRELRYWSLLLFAPIPYILLMMNRQSVAGQVIIGGFCLATLAVLAARAGNLHAEHERFPMLQPRIAHFGRAQGQ